MSYSTTNLPLGAVGAGVLSISGGSNGISLTESNSHQFDGMDIRVTVANNGTIVSVREDGYGSKPKLYVIHNDQDLGQEIGKIITMICLKKE